MQSYLYTSLLIFLFSTLTLSSPARHKKPKVAQITSPKATPTQTSQVAFDVSLPWKLSNIVIFDATANSTLNSSISFTFNDPNQGMQITTNCTRSVKPGQDLTSNFYSHCAIPEGLQFQYDNDQIWIYRFIQDPR
jgi:hypothetical protein